MSVGMSLGLYGVTVVLGGRTALDDVTVRAGPGDLTAVIGADGAGKTTTARTLVGLVGADRGEVGRPGAGRIGYQPEAGGTWLDLTVDENLALVARAHRMGVRGVERRAELLDVTALERAHDRLAGLLSGGMRQKLAVAMAMLPGPELVVLDEPTTGLDPVSRSELWGLLGRAAAEGAAVVVTTTYLDEAERADHVVVLDGGRVLASGTAASIRGSFRGSLTVDDRRPDDADLAWRRGRSWRRWWPEGAPGSGSPVEPDLDDVVTAAALSRRGLS